VKRLTQLEAVSGGITMTTEPAILAGKFRVPAAGPGILRRDRLTALIDQAAERPVTVITAPPGAGKTVAVAGWAAARARSRRIAWLGLDEGDRDPARFWACMTTALAGGGGPVGPALVPRSRDSGEDMPGDLVNAVRKLSGSLVLVIDDVHVLAGSEVLPGLALLIHHAPATLRLILCGRSAHGLHLAKMRLSGGLSEVRGSDLACAGQEAEAYFDHLGLPDDPADRESLLAHTEGWMAGPRLAALIAARDGGLDVDAVAGDPVVAEYMRDEVLDRQPLAVRRFLRRTSVAERVPADLADWLTGEPGSTRVLGRLHADNALVSRDGRGGYRFHPFLRQVLLGELRAELPDEVATLYGRAARWNAGQGDVIEAVRCVAEAGQAEEGQWDAAASVLTEAGLAGALTDRVAEFETALGRLPAHLRADPAVAAALAMARLCRGDRDSTEAYLGMAETALGPDGPGRDDTVPDQLVIELWLATLRLLRLPGPDTIAACLPLAERARLSAGRQQEHQAAGLLWLALGSVLLRRGELITAGQALTAAHHQLTAAGVSGLAMRARGWLAIATALSGDLVTAADLAGRLAGAGSAELALLPGPAALPDLAAVPGAAALSDDPAVPPDPAARCLATIAAAQVALDRDDLVGAARLLDEADPAAVTPLPGEPDLAVLLATARARVALAEGDVERARDLALLVRDKFQTDGPLLSVLEFDAALRAGDLAVAAGALLPGPNGSGPGGPGARPDQTAARARLLLAEGEPAAALVLALDAAREDGPDGAPPGTANDAGERPPPTRRDRVTALLTAMIAARRSGTDGEAARHLEEALAQAEPQDLYRPFLDAGGAVHSAIALLVAPASPVAGFAARVHERFVTQPSSRTTSSGTAASEVTALTASELAVLRLLRSYMSNQDIADTLFLSVNTVKTHLRSVYYKLGVSSRREAVERGVRLRIL
jgi:LuxR family maltose regulon positive regulatory protein